MSENNLTEVDKKLIRQMNLRSLTVFAPFNYAIQGGSGFFYVLQPFLNYYYKEDEEAKLRAYERSIGWYNVTQNVGTFVMGLIASMEKENSLNEDFDEESISAVKASLMGPLSGIGDTIFWGILRVIAAGIAIPFAQQGNFLAPFIFLLIYNIPSLLTRFSLGKLGFEAGAKYITQIYESGLMKTLTRSASILGLIVLGGMTGSLVNLQTTLNFSLGADTNIVVQEFLDQIFVGILPLSFTLICLYLLSKKKVNFTLLIILVVVFGLLLSFFGIA